MDVVFLAEPLAAEDIRKYFSGSISEKHELRWDERKECVVSRTVMMLGAIEFAEMPSVPTAPESLPVMIEAIRRMGPDSLPWTPGAASFRTRSEWLRKRGLVGEDWPDLDGSRLSATLEDWLSPYIHGMTKKSDLQRLDLLKILQSMYSFRQLREIDRLAPTHLVVPTGSRIPVDYAAPDTPPVLAVRLQEMFGQTETPAVGGGTVPVLLHLLSPARRPLAVTQDLPSFWKNAYPEVRKDMRGQYPKHEWPEDPLHAEPTRRAKKRTGK